MPRQRAAGRGGSAGPSAAGWAPPTAGGRRAGGGRSARASQTMPPRSKGKQPRKAGGGRTGGQQLPAHLRDKCAGGLEPVTGLGILFDLVHGIAAAAAAWVRLPCAWPGLGAGAPAEGAACHVWRGPAPARCARAILREPESRASRPDSVDWRATAPPCRLHLEAAVSLRTRGGGLSQIAVFSVVLNLSPRVLMPAGFGRPATTAAPRGRV